MASGSFASYQAPQYGHVDNGVAYSPLQRAYDSVKQTGYDPALANACSPMNRWLNESRQDEPFHAFNLDNSSYSHDAAAHDSLPMVRWLGQTRQDEPFSVFTMKHGNYSDDRAAVADFGPLWTSCAEEPEEGDA
ncbi:hypothetical protein PG984_016391 [Apiospora sp. TS-2023a]